MKKTLILLLFTVQLFSQNKFEIKQLGFSIEGLEGWTEVKNEDIDIAGATIKELDSLLKNSATLVSYYDGNGTTSLEPTLNITVKNKELKGLGELTSYVFKVSKDFEQLLPNYKSNFSGSINIGQNKGVTLFSTHDAYDSSGNLMEVHSRAVFLSVDKFIILVIVLDTNAENVNSIFHNLVKTIKLNR